MKLIFLLFLITLCKCGQGADFSFNGAVPAPPSPIAGSQQLNFVNTNTGTIAASLPAGLTNSDGSVNLIPDVNAFSNAGWRIVQQPVMPPLSGIYAPSGYTFTDNGDGTATLITLTNLNTIATADAQFTNSIYWTAGLLADLHSCRSIIEAYQGPGAETNAVISPQTTLQYLATHPAFAAVQTNVVNALVEVMFVQEFKGFFPQVQTSTAIPWRLVP